MGRRSWVIVLFCLFIVSLILSQSSSASTSLRVNEAATRILLETGRTGASLVVENTLGRKVEARVSVALIDPQGRVRASAERVEVIDEGTATLFIPLNFQFSDLKETERNQFIWYRLHYIVAYKASLNPAENQSEGIISLSTITPDIFEVRVAASEYGREGVRYRSRLRAIHPIDGHGIAGVGVEAQVKIEDDENEPTILKAYGTTDGDGFTTLDFDLPRGIKAEGAEIKVIARRGQFVQQADDTIHFDNLSRIFISTDKPLYQPGQTLHARALIFSPSMRAIAGVEMPFKITDPEGTTVFRAQLKTSRFGAASADWAIPDNTRLGEYTIAFGRDDSSYASYRIKVSRYDLPNFTAKVKPDHSFYLPGQNARIEVRADYLFGHPVKRGRVRVVRETEREWNYREQKWETEEEDKYEGETDVEGRFIAQVNLESAHEDLRDSSWHRFKDITYAAYFTDVSTGRSEQRRFDLRVTKEPIHVYVTRDTYHQTSRLPLEFYLSTFYADGAPAQCEVLLSKGSEDDREVDVPKPRTGGRRVATVRTNTYGLAKVSNLKPPVSPDDDRVYLRFAAHDSLGAVGHTNEDFYYEDKAAIRVSTTKSLYRLHEPLSINLLSSEKDLNVIVDVSKDMQVLRSEMVRMRDGRASITIPYEEQFKNEVKVTAYADITAQDYVRDGRIVLYPVDQDLKLDVRTGKETYRPGEDAHVNFNVRASAGIAAESALGVVIFDRAVEERARTDQEFGSGFNLYGNYGGLLGWDDSLAGVTRKDLQRLDLSKPQPEELYLLAEVMLNRNGYYSPSVFGGDNYELNQAAVFGKLINDQFKPTLDALNIRYEKRVEYPSDEASLKRILAESGIDFDALLDPWGIPYRPRFLTENQNNVLKIESAGADKRFETADDFSVAVLSRPYFRLTGEAIDLAVEKYHARTKGYIRDQATLINELLREGVKPATLRDRWGERYVLEFDVLGVNYVLRVRSKGPNRVLDGLHNSQNDDFLLWSSMIDYFAERRAEIDAALNAHLKATRRFPQDVKSLRAALGNSKIDLDALRDAWGHACYATFKTESRFANRVRHVARSVYGQQPKPGTEVTPVTQKLGIVTLRSAGPDGKEGTPDDFDAATFTLVLSEQNSSDPKPQPKRVPVILKGNGGGAISGTVLDPNGAALANMSVRATLLSTQQFYEAMTDDNGNYAIRNLPPGLYEVSIEASGGFMATKVTEVLVRSRNITEVNLTLHPGSVTSVVTVTATAENATTVATSFSVSNRSARSLVRTDPNVVTRSGGGNVSTPRLREYFPETLLWQPLLETDAQGRAEIRFKLADNITTWKLAVIGSTPMGEIGMAEKEILAFQPFFVEHDPPRILTEGDEIQLPVILRNYLDKPQAVNLEIKPENWFALLGPAQKRAEAQSGDNARETFDFRAIASVKDGKQRITATGAEVSDQIEKPVSVHPDGEEVAKTVSGILADSVTLQGVIPTDAIRGTARSELKIYPDLMAHVVESIEGILMRPYGCAEQTISAAYPSLIFLRAHKRTGSESPVTAKARRYVRAGYERLLNYRASSGGFSYWGRGDADLALTAYALRFLQDARDFIEVDASVMTEAREWLVKQQRGDGSWPASSWWEKAENRQRTAILTAYIARVLAIIENKGTADQTVNDTGTQPATTSAPLKRALLYLSERYHEIDEPYLIASYALASIDAGQPERVKEAITKLLSLTHEEAGASYWSLETNTPFYGWGLAGRIETTALVLQALGRYCGMRISDCGSNKSTQSLSNPHSALDNPQSVRPQSAIPIPQLIDRGLLFLLRQQDRYGVWYSTQATVNTLDALVTLLSADSTGSPRVNGAGAPGRTEVFVNGRLATTIEMPPDNQLWSPLMVDLSQFVSPGDNRIEIRRGAKSARSTVQLVSTYYVPWPQRKAASHSNREDSARSLRLGVSYDKSASRVNDEITCKVEAERIGFKGYGMLLAEIGLPPGADVDRSSLERAMKESGWTFSQYDILPDRLIVYLWPQAGGTNFVFKFRPRFGLAAQTAPSILYDYYNPEARAVVAPTKFVVK